MFLALETTEVGYSSDYDTLICNGVLEMRESPNTPEGYLAPLTTVLERT